MASNSNSAGFSVSVANLDLPYFAGQITYTKDTGAEQSGVYADGSYWIKGTVVGMSPDFEADAARVDEDGTNFTADVHGWMINPGAYTGGGSTLLEKQQANFFGEKQSYDGFVGGFNLTYLPGLRPSLPITGTGSLVKVRSQITGVDRNARPSLEYLGVATLVDTVPAPGSIRPPIPSTDVTPILNENDINLGVLRNLQSTGVFGVSYEGCKTLLGRGITFQHYLNVQHRNIVAPNGTGRDPYHGDTAEDFSRVLLSLHTDSMTPSEKKDICIQVGMIACDTAAAAYEGIVRKANGGHCRGHHPMIAFAAEVFDSDYLRDACKLLAQYTDGNDFREGTSVYGDMSQLYYATQLMIEDSKGRDWPLPDGYLGYPQWGSQHGVPPVLPVSGDIMGTATGNEDNTGITNSLSYESIIGKALPGFSLALRLLQLPAGKEPIMPELYHDYSHRYLEYFDKGLYTTGSVPGSTNNPISSGVVAGYNAWSPLVRNWNPTITFGLLGQSEPNYFFDTAGFYNQLPSAPAVVVDGVKVNGITITDANKANTNPGSIAMANMLTHLFPGRPIFIQGFTDPGTSLDAMLDDSDPDRTFSQFTNRLDGVLEEASRLDVLVVWWWNSIASSMKDYTGNYFHKYFGEYFSGSAFTIGEDNADNIFWDITAYKNAFGRGVLAADRTKIQVLPPGPYIKGPGTAAANYYDVHPVANQLDRPARNSVDAFMADSRISEFAAPRKISAHNVRFGDELDGAGASTVGGSSEIHPSVQDPNGQYYAAQHMAVAMAQAYGKLIYEPEITGMTVAGDNSYADIEVSLPNGGTLTTIRKLRSLGAPSSPVPHYQPVMGFEIAPDSADANLSPFGFTADVQDSGSGDPKVGTIRITPDTPFSAGDVIEFLRGAASCVLEAPRDQNALLYLDMPIEHVPALEVPGDSHPYHGIPVKPQPPALVV